MSSKAPILNARNPHSPPNRMHGPTWLDETGGVDFVAFPFVRDILPQNLGNLLLGRAIAQHRFI